jgi:hypothetical protein
MHDRTVTRSFRVDESALRVIESDADAQGVTVNTFVNQLFLKYARVQRFLAKERWYEFPEPVLKDLFASLSEDQIATMGKKHGKELGLRNLIHAMMGDTSPINIIRFLKLVCDVNALNYTETEDSRCRTFTVMHNLNRQFSVFLSNVFTTALENAGTWPRVTSDDRMVIFEYEV